MLRASTIRAFGTLALLTSPCLAADQTVVIEAKMNVFAASRSTTTGFGGGLLPYMFRFTPQSGQVLTFSSLTGLIHTGGGTPTWGPDGIQQDTTLPSVQGISGITSRQAVFLVGVFLDDSTPANPAPPSLDFHNGALGIEFAELRPLLRQTFFIGDGRTGITGVNSGSSQGPNGAFQQFHVPAGATRLFLGVADPVNYDDNNGSFNATFNIGAGTACTYTLNPASSAIPAAGGTGSFQVSTQAGCAWTAASGSAFVTITTGATGSGSGTVNYSVDANSATTARAGAITAGGQTHAVNQAAAQSCSFTLNPTSIQAPAGGGNPTIQVTASSSTCAWSAATTTPWIAIASGSSGAGAGIVTLSVQPNSSMGARSGTVTVAGQTVTVTQAPVTCTFTAGPANISAAASGGFYPVVVTASSSTCTWTAISTTPWISINLGSTGTGNGQVSLSVDGNTTLTQRSGTVTVAGQTITVNQAAQTCAFTVIPASLSAPAAGGPSTLLVTANNSACQWTAATTTPWISITSGSSGTGSGPVAISIQANAAGSPRDGALTVAGRTVAVTQAAANCTYTVTPLTNAVSALGGAGSVQVAAAAGCAWTAVSSVPWITIPAGGSGSGAGTVNYNVAGNPNNSSRSGTLTIGGQTHTVTQAAVTAKVGPQTGQIDAGSNIFAAGHATPDAVGGGLLPFLHRFEARAGQVLTFSSVTGTTQNDVGAMIVGPDGGIYRTDVSSAGGISGIVHNCRYMFLTGVFLDDSEPSGAAPARLNFSADAQRDDFTTLSPALRQTFFIGDGLTGTGSGARQQFLVPATATRLFLGFVDAFDLIGEPGGYYNNTDGLSASFEIAGAAPAGGGTGAGPQTGAIDARSNIFASGRTTTDGIGGGVLPYTFRFAPQASQVLTFSSVTGLTHNGGGTPSWGPDGIDVGIETNFNSVQGISGIASRQAVYLVGVFLDDSTPANPAPPSLDFRTGALGIDFAEVRPLLRQTFFIGDGRTGTGAGAVQQFHVPTGATRLFLGFADAPPGQSVPSSYDDNKGSLNATFTIAGPGGSTGGGTCTYSINPVEQTIPATGGQSTVTFTTGAGCPWAAIAPIGVTWIRLTPPASGLGSGSFTYSAEANTGAERRAEITVAGLRHTVIQSAAATGGGTPAGGGAGTPQTGAIDARSNIFAAGRANTDGIGGGVLPYLFRFTAGANQILTFSSVTGLTHNGGGTPSWGPDGIDVGIETNFNAVQGISGIACRQAVYLVGVFLDDSAPANPAPPSLDFRASAMGIAFAELRPLLRQTFFVGGRTGTGAGAVQQFYVPAGATRLFLGFADAPPGQSVPSSYDDNKGALNATFTISGPGGSTGGSTGGGTGAPAFTRNSVTPAPLDTPGPIAAGSLFTIRGTDLGPSPGGHALNYPLQNDLEGVSIRITRGSVTVNALPILVSQPEIHAVMPSNAPLGEVELTVTRGSSASAPVPIFVNGGSFSIFSASGDGKGPGLFQDAAGEPISRSRPAKTREVVRLLGTGLGPLLLEPDNQAPSAGAALPLYSHDVLVGGVRGRVIRKARSPFTPGVDIIEFEVPPNAPGNCSATVQVMSGTDASNTVTIPIAAAGEPACADNPEVVP